MAFLIASSLIFSLERRILAGDLSNFVIALSGYNSFKVNMPPFTGKSLSSLPVSARFLAVKSDQQSKTNQTPQLHDPSG